MNDQPLKQHSMPQMLRDQATYGTNLHYRTGQKGWATDNDALKAAAAEIERLENRNVANKRELFAAMAMQRLIVPVLAETNQHQREHTEQVAYWATQYADALLRELGK